MATHSSTLAWEIPWMEEAGRLQSMGLQRVRHDWATSLLLFTFLHWRRKWQPTPVFLPGESQGRGRLVGCRQRGCTVRHDWSDLAAAAMCVFQCYSYSSSHSFPPCVHKSFLYVSVSIPAQQIGSSVPFSRFYMCALVRNICFSDLLHSLWQILSPSVLPQMTRFCSFYGWVIFHCIHEPHLLYP